MRIQHNIMAMTAYRNYNTNTSALSKNLEKLSSGYKINRAGDDAAGLAISEKMRAQITGLEAAQKNVKDGISLVKTGEGAMQEIQDMLNRMDYLATQSANGTYDNEVDRANLQKEVEALSKEINRIADSANFNGIKLLDGSLSDRAAVPASSTTETTTVAGSDRILKSTGDAFTDIGTKTILDGTKQSAAKAKITIDLNKLSFDIDESQIAASASATSVAFEYTLTINGEDFTISGSKATNAAYTIASGSKAATVTKTDVTAANVAKDFVAVAKGSGSKAIVSINDVDWEVSENGGVLTFTQVENPSTASEAVSNFDVTIKTNASDTASDGKAIIKGNINAAVSVATAGQVAIDAMQANTIFKINASDIVDGAQITIGTKTVTLKVGANSKVTDAAAVDLSNMEEGSGIDLNAALTKISVAFGAQVNAKATASGGNGQVTLKVGVSNTENGHGATGLSVSRNDTGTKVVYDTVDKLAAEFSMTTSTTKEIEAVEAGNALVLQIGDTSDDFNRLEVSIGDMHTDAMGVVDAATGKVSGKTIADINIGTSEGAKEAIDIIKGAINYVSSIRGDLGAVQNRLEHTANNLSVMAENIQDAESTIRDTDVAEEMMAYTKNNILVQSAQAMLAQANAVPQGVLQLLG